MGSFADTIIHEAAQLWMTRINYFAPTALFCYDYLLTIDREVRLWQQGSSFATLLFSAVRYPALLNTIFVIMDLTSWKGMSDTGSRPWWEADSQLSCSCTVVTRIEMVLDIIVLTAAALFSSLRVYAVSGRDRRWTALTLVFGLVSPAIVILTFVDMRNRVLAVAPGSTICGFSTTIAKGAYENWMIGARTSSVFADLIVLAVTWARILPVCRPLARGTLAANGKTSLSGIILEDGTVYFLVLLAANVVGLSLIRHLCFLEPMSTWISVLTAIMTSRFILDLHDANDALRGTSGPGGGRAPSPPLVFGDAPHLGDAGAGIYGAVVLSIDCDARHSWDEGGADADEERAGGDVLWIGPRGELEEGGTSANAGASARTSARSSMVGRERVVELYESVISRIDTLDFWGRVSEDADEERVGGEDALRDGRLNACP
ncbi:hypothetical protein OH77DRAFT_1433901 [Trametes cingulata]|nr:hypothetical protein OH77DRAFT_1433901 [Trametes cingulata]